ncbi:MAG: DNA integrity scanning diadenylate cyclase DisA [Candidatus Pacearchaeota archaeon]
MTEKKKNNKKREELEEGEKEFINVLKKFSPGTKIREALDDLMRARMGALIVVSKEGISRVRTGGFKVDTKFTPQKLVELAKMDGAIIFSEDMEKITHVNTLLAPDVKISTKETGTRHQSAERTAKELNTITIAVSERKNKITVYYGDKSYVLGDGAEVLRKATETLQILEKQKEIYKETINNLNVLEISDIVTVEDICSVLKRIEIIKRISNMVRRKLVELGNEGLIVNMRLKELTAGLDKTRSLILKDYFKARYSKVDKILQEMRFDSLVETSNISKSLFGDSYGKDIKPKGYRILGKTNLPEYKVDKLVKEFKNLTKVLGANKESISKILTNPKVVESFLEDLKNLRDKILVGKQIT